MRRVHRGAAFHAVHRAAATRGERGPARPRAPAAAARHLRTSATLRLRLHRDAFPASTAPIFACLPSPAAGERQVLLHVLLQHGHASLTAAQEERHLPALLPRRPRLPRSGRGGPQRGARDPRLEPARSFPDDTASQRPRAPRAAAARPARAAAGAVSRAPPRDRRLHVRRLLRQRRALQAAQLRQRARRERAAARPEGQVHLQRVRQALRDVVQPVAPQADAPQPRLGGGQALHRVRQGVRVHAGAGDAPADAPAVARVRRVRQAVLAALAAARPPALAHGREAVRVRALRQGVRGPLQLARAHADALGRQELRVSAMPQDVRAQELPQQAPGVGLRAGRRLAAAGGARVRLAADRATTATRDRTHCCNIYM